MHLVRKYSFLWELSQKQQQAEVFVYMIYKIELYPHYTYPTVNLPNHHQQQLQQHTCGIDVLQKEKLNDSYLEGRIIEDLPISPPTTPPYRTVSHYGFNYPLTYKRDITVHPVCSLTPVELQRQKVITFIRRLNMETGGYLSVGKLKCPKIKANENENEKIPNSHVLEKTGSYISIKEMHLLNKQSKKATEAMASPGVKHSRRRNVNSKTDSEDNSSLLSVSGTYPTNSRTHSVDLEPEHENFINTTDSGDNCSIFGFGLKTSDSNSLYKVGNLREALIEAADDGVVPDPHKPEAEQITSMQSYYNDDDTDKHVILTVNSLKRRASPTMKKTADKNNNTNSSRNTCSSHETHTHSSSEAAAIEIHINVSVQNRDCIRSLQMHEEEFKAKLQKLIDDEVNLIAQQLANDEDIADQQQQEHDKNHCHFYENTMSQATRCLSAPESINLWGRMYDQYDVRSATPLSPPLLTMSPYKDIPGENVQNGDHSEAHLSTFSHSSKEDISTDGSPKKDKKKKKGLRTPSFLKKKKEKKKPEA